MGGLVGAALATLLDAATKFGVEVFLGWLDRWQARDAAEKQGAAEADARADASTAAAERRAAEVAPVTEDEAIDRLEKGEI